ncbi:MAG: excisionase [Schaedlerella sp.]|nr:excisionase [Lachnospiraceae bacterium]MDY4202216.1 excisionase [Schaedlerella sp.]
MNTLKNLISSNDDEEIFMEVRAYQNKLISDKEGTPIWEKKWLTIEEASAYSGIGRGKLRELSKTAGCPFAIWMGSKIHIVREKLDKYTATHDRI